MTTAAEGAAGWLKVKVRGLLQFDPGGDTWLACPLRFYLKRTNMDFIAFDWCGFNENLGRFTHMPSGDTLVQQGFDQRKWDQRQLEFFKKYPGLTVYNNERPGPYRPEGKVMGTTEEICARLERRLAI